MKEGKKFNKKKLFHILWIIPLTLLVIIFLLRLTNIREIDDVHPNIPCEQEYLEKSEILWVVPKFKGVLINETPEWCEQILSMNKTLGLHGIYHEYKEFEREEFTEEEILEAIQIFEGCFGFEPEIFKPPQLHISKQNKELIEKHFKLYYWQNQVIHKVYHCDNDTKDKEFGGIFSNKFHDLI